ncbi:cyclic GMP-AMP synthase [Labeo rohita]|uniref:Cyclic GMP-AMP synthase n=2 Tax=Labeo rohita TaxID=84645 RepID=A0A498NET9_LABRO|nr:cyclic GMP-AMP synthase [Labeo rohita]KAI2657842.1 Cyclic GMP-AMP synthase [Labeo rohita]RXN30646.1 cyclic GMP-AMP synthase [Labeo rohita]
MNRQRRPDSFRATSPDQPKAKARTKTNATGKSKEQGDHHTTDRGDQSQERAKDKCAPRRGSRKQRSDPNDCGSADNPHESPAPKRGTIHQQSKKQKDLRSGSSETPENKYEEKRASASRGVPVHNNADENDKQDSAKSKRQSKRYDCESKDEPQQTAKSKSDEKTAPKRQSRKQREPLNFDKEEPLKSSSEAKSTSKPRTRLELATKTESSDASNPREASQAPAVSVLSDRQKKSAERATAMRALSVDDTLGKILKTTIEKLKIKKHERSNASSCVNDITAKVIAHLKQNVSWCEGIDSLRSGSYYENLKICEPDEFDVMLTFPVERVDIQKFDEAGAFYTVALKRHSNRHPLDRFLNEDKTIKASKMLSEFREAVKEAVEKLPYKIEMLRKKPRCPAVTLEVKTEENGKTISVDFVLGLKVHTAWPGFTTDGFKIENWLGRKEKNNMKRQPFYLVPKYEGKGNAEHDGVVAEDAWRISFSHVEKEILKRHGQSKTCCEYGNGQKCCRKECLKLLKYLLHKLKEDNSKSSKISSFCSYHAKTTLLHACADRGADSEWAYSQLADCFQQLLEDFVKYLRNRQLSNFFIPSHNLLHHVSRSNCEFLANEIEFQRNNNFPIFS